MRLPALLRPESRFTAHWFSTLCVLLLTGCGVGTVAPVKTGSPAPQPAAKLSGSVYGGQQPVAGAQLYLYAVGTTAGGPAQSLLTTSGGYVTTNNNGNWTITGDYTCPANSYVYVLALGGNPGLVVGTNNPRLALASILGPCSAIEGQFFVVNEITTVTAASALAGIASSETQIGTDNLNVVVNAVTRNTTLIDPATGRARTVTPDQTGTVKQAKIDSLADSISSCVNSDGTGPLCQALMDDSGLSSTSLTPDTFNASILIAQNPAGDPYDIYALSPPAPPFEPMLVSSPDDWNLAPQYSGDTSGNGLMLTPSSATIAPGGQVDLAASGGGISYHWSTSGSLGSLTDPGGGSGQTTFCTTSAQVTYVSNGNSLTAPASDAVMVQQFAVPGCFGNPQGFATAAVVTAPPAAVTTLPGTPTESFTATVVLPAGVNLPLDALTVSDSITQTTPSTSGTFTLPKYSGGPQIVLVNAPDGSPLLTGWMDANHATVDSGTTAEVLLFYAIGGASMLAESDREATIAQIPQVQDFNTLSSVVESELSANVDALAAPDAPLIAALNSLFTETTGFQLRTTTGTVRPHDVAISPSASTLQSGVSIGNTEPGGSYSTTSPVTPYSTFLTNTYRRRTHYFIIRKSETLGQSTNEVDAQIADADVSATVGLNGGVTGALVDLVKAYFGTQPYAYAPVTTDPIELPVDSGYDATTYQIINVGAGGSGAASPVMLSGPQKAILFTTAVNGFVSDTLVPFINNVLINTQNDSDATNNTALSGSPRSPFVLALETNIANVVNQLPGEQDKLVAGDYKGAIGDLLYNGGTQPLVNSAIKAALASAVPSANSIASVQAVEKFEGFLAAANAGLQVFDSAVYLAQLAQSNNVDVWTVVSTKYKATLTPAATTLNSLGNAQLTAAAKGVPSSALLSYRWTIAPQSGQSLVGTITEVGGSGQTLPDAMGNTAVCSSSATWDYSNNASAFQALTIPTTDTVTVTVYQGANCPAAAVLTNTPSATITNNANPMVVINPPAPQIEAGETVALTASFHNPKTMTQPAVGSWSWKLLGAGGGAVYGTLSNGDGSDTATGQIFCSTSNAVTYTSTQTDPITAPQTDLAEATAYPQAGCMGTAMATQPGIASITTRTTPNLVISPTHATLQAAGTVTINVTFPSLDATGFHYQWTTAGTVGKLTDSGTGGSGTANQLSYCTASSMTTFAASSARVTVPQSDSVSVTAYDGPDCSANNQIGRKASALITLQPTPSTAGTPTQMLGQMQASDGFVYAIGSYAAPEYQGVLNFPAQTLGDTLFQIQPDGSVRSVATFTHTVYDSYHQQTLTVLDAISPVVEGPDDALYGLAANGGSSSTGYFFRFSLVDGSVTVLHTFSNADGSFGTDQYGNNLYVGALQGPLLLASDGNFYVGGSGGVVKITPAGQVSLAYTVGSPTSYGPFVQATDGNLYSSLTTPPVTDSNGNQTSPGDISLTSVALQGGGNAVYDFGGPVYPFASPSTPLVAGADGALYGVLRGERAGFGACEIATTSNTDPGICKPIHAASIFRLSGGGYSTIYTFSSLADGTEPLVGLIPGPDGNLYGAATAGGDLDNECVTFPAQYEVTTGSNYYGTVGPVRVNDEGCGTIFRITPSGTYTRLYQFQDGPEGRLSLGLGSTSDYGVQLDANLALDSAGDLLGASAMNPSGSYTVTATEIFKLPLFANGPIQMSLSQSTVAAGTQVTLNWTVSNAFSLSAQQCYAHGITGTGGGTWTGKQTGVADSSGFHGSQTLTPTAAGTYSYALTCGGTESGFATLTVQ